MTEKRGLSRGARIALGVLAAAVAVLGIGMIVVIVRWDAMLKERIADDARKRGFDVSYDQIQDWGLLPWQSGEPTVVLKGVKAKSRKPKGVSVELEKATITMKGFFPFYEASKVEARHAVVTAPDIETLALATKSPESDSTRAVIESIEVRVDRIASSLPASILGRAARLDVKAGKPSTTDATIEGTIASLNNASYGPTAVTLERAGDMTWLALPEVGLRIGVRDDGGYVKLEARGIDSGPIAKKLHFELPATKASGDVELERREGVTSGTFAVTLDGYVPSHPQELNPVLNEKATRISGKPRDAGDVIEFDDVKVESGGLKLTGKARFERANGGVLSSTLEGRIPCSALAPRGADKQAGGGLGDILGPLAKGAMTGDVRVTVKILAKMSDLKNASITSTKSDNCGVLGVQPR